MKKTYIALIFMWILIVGLLIFNIVKNKNISPNGFDISKKNFNDIKSYSEDNNIKALTIINMESREAITLYSTNK